MRATPLAAPEGALSRRKRLELDNDLDTECPTRKQARRGPQPQLPPCLLPLSPPPAPARALTVTTASRLGPYVLLKPEEGGQAYRALHCPTGIEYTCKVGLLGSLPAPPPASQGPRKGLCSRGLSGRRRPLGYFVPVFIGEAASEPPVQC